MRNKLIFIGMVILGLVAIIAWFTGKPEKYQLSNPFAANMRYPYQVSESEIYFFSGSAFGAYNLESHKTTALTPHYRLPNITDVRWTQRGALFKASDYSQLDQLYSVLRASLKPVDDAHWWVVNFETNKINLVEQASGLTQDAIWKNDGETYYFVTSTPDTEDESSGTSIVFESHSMRAPSEVARFERPVQLYWADQENMIVGMAEDNQTKLYSLNLSSGSTELLFDGSVANVTPSKNGENILFVDIEETSEEGDFPAGPLYLFNTTSKELRIINKQFSGSLFWSMDSSSWVTYGNNKGLRAINTSAEAVEFALEIPESQAGSIYSIAGVVGSNLLFVNELNQLALAGEEAPANLPHPGDISALKEPVFKNRFYITYDAQTEIFTVLILNNPYSLGIKDATDYIKDRGVDPLQIHLELITNDGVNPNS